MPTYFDSYYQQYYTVNPDGSRNWLPRAQDLPVRNQTSTNTNTTVTVNIPKRVNHLLHLILTVLTCGLWAPVWLVIAIAGGR